MVTSRRVRSAARRGDAQVKAGPGTHRSAIFQVPGAADPIVVVWTPI
jgi:hypothetical protein